VDVLRHADAIKASDYSPGGGRIATGQHLDGRGFSRALGPRKPTTASSHAQVDVVHGCEVSETPGQMFSTNRGEADRLGRFAFIEAELSGDLPKYLAKSATTHS
jgi:hypothetical protein